MTTINYIEYYKQNARILKELIPKIKYKDNWGFSVFSSGGNLNRYVFRIIVQAPDSRKTQEPDQYFRAPYVSTSTTIINTTVGSWHQDPFWLHPFPVEPYPMDERALWRWIFEKILLVEKHEAMEGFKIDDVAVFFPDHSDPYRVPGDL